MHSTAAGAAARMLFRSFSRAVRCSSPSAAKYSSIVVGLVFGLVPAPAPARVLPLRPARAFMPDLAFALILDRTLSLGFGAGFMTPPPFPRPIGPGLTSVAPVVPHVTRNP